MLNSLMILKYKAESTEKLHKIFATLLFLAPITKCPDSSMSAKELAKRSTGRAQSLVGKSTNRWRPTALQSRATSRPEANEARSAQVTFAGALVGGECLERPAHLGAQRALLVGDRLLRRRRHGGGGGAHRGRCGPREAERALVVVVGGGGRGAGRRQEVEAHHQGGHGIFNHLPPRAPLARPPCLIADARPAVRVPLPPPPPRASLR